MIIWLASYPKSGNTWVRLFLKHYFKEPEEKFKINSLSANEFKNITFPDPNLLREMGINYSKFEEIVIVFFLFLSITLFISNLPSGHN